MRLCNPRARYQRRMVCCFGAVLRGTRGAATTAHSSRQHLEVDVRGDSRRADRLRARWATSECNHDGSCQSLRHNSCRRDCQRWCVWQSRSPNASDRVGAGGSRLASNKNLTRAFCTTRTSHPSLGLSVFFLSFFYGARDSRALALKEKHFSVKNVCQGNRVTTHIY